MAPGPGRWRWAQNREILNTIRRVREAMRRRNLVRPKKSRNKMRIYRACRGYPTLYQWGRILPHTFCQCKRDLKFAEIIADIFLSRLNPREREEAEKKLTRIFYRAMWREQHKIHTSGDRILVAVAALTWRKKDKTRPHDIPLPPRRFRELVERLLAANPPRDEQEREREKVLRERLETLPDEI